MYRILTVILLNLLIAFLDALSAWGEGGGDDA